MKPNRNRAIRVLVIAICMAPVYAQERSYKSVGGLDVAIDTLGEIVFRWHGSEYEISLASLPIPKSIPADTRESYRFTMGGVLGIYEPTETVYLLAAGDDGWQMRPWTVFAYNLKSEHITDIAKTSEVSRLGSSAISPSGRYVALSLGIRAGFMGSCSYEYIAVIDVAQQRHVELREWRSGEPPDGDGLGQIKRIRWIDPTHFEVQADVVHPSQCYQGTPARDHSSIDVIDAAKLAFQ